MATSFSRTASRARTPFDGLRLAIPLSAAMWAGIFVMWGVFH